METNLILNDERDKLELIKFYHTKLDSINDNIKSIQLQLDMVIADRARTEFLLNQLTGKVVDLLYKEEWTWVEKIFYIIDKKGAPLKTKDIVSFLAELEPKINETYEKHYQSISSFISQKVKSGELKKFRLNEGSENFYAPTDWIKNENSFRLNGYVLYEKENERLVRLLTEIGDNVLDNFNKNNNPTIF